MSKIGKGLANTVLAEGVYYYNALTEFINSGSSYAIAPFKYFGYGRPLGRNKPRETNWSGRTYLNNGYNTGNPLTPDTFERQDVTRNVFGRDYYINIQNGIININQCFDIDNIFPYVNGDIESDPTTALTPGELGASPKDRRIRVSGSTDGNLNGIYVESPSNVYTKLSYGSTITLIGGYWTLTVGAVDQYVADADTYSNPWDVGSWTPLVPSGTLLVEDDIREFTWQPLINFVNSFIGRTPTFCNIFATMSFDQYCILGTRWPAYTTNTRPVIQREPFANLAWPAVFRVYYKDIILPRT